MEMLFLYGFPIIAVALLVAIGIILAVLKMCPTAWLLFRSKLGIGPKGKAYALVGWDDRLLTTEEMDMYPDGAMEKKKKRGRSLTFFLARPRDDTDNPDANMEFQTLEKDVLPPYVLDGVIPVYLGHVSKAIATNPKVLMALHMANRVQPKQRVVKAEALLPKPVTYTDGGEEVTTQTVPVNVVLPCDVVSIKKNFPDYWQQSYIDAKGKRGELIGMEKSKLGSEGLMKMMLIVGAVVSVAIIVSGIVSKLLGA